MLTESWSARCFMSARWLAGLCRASAFAHGADALHPASVPPADAAPSCHARRGGSSRVARGGTTRTPRALRSLCAVGPAACAARCWRCAAGHAEQRCALFCASRFGRVRASLSVLAVRVVAPRCLACVRGSAQRSSGCSAWPGGVAHAPHGLRPTGAALRQPPPPAILSASSPLRCAAACRHRRYTLTLCPS